jgi:hypothetical protein
MSRGKIIGIAVIAAIAVLFVVSPDFRDKGRYLWDTVNNWRYRSTQKVRSGSQIPGGSQAVELAQRCRNSMRSIETAKRAIMGESGYVQAGTRVTYQDVASRLGVNVGNLVCPQTGEAYRLGGVADEVSCSVGINGTPTFQGDDHAIGNI